MGGFEYKLKFDQINMIYPIYSCINNTDHSSNTISISTYQKPKIKANFKDFSLMK